MSDQRIRKMLQEMVGSDAVAVSSPMASVKKGAALAHVAEQFGFTYAGARQHGYRNSQLSVVLVRDPRPEAEQRAAATTAQYPHAGGGGPVPGLQQGTLKPLPEAQPAVDLLKARITFDITGKGAEKRILLGMAAVVAGCLIGAVVKGGGTGGAFFGYGVVAVLLCAVLGGGLLWTRSRNSTAERLLQSAGLQQTRDDAGHVRYVWPGLQPPGQAAGREHPGRSQPYPPQQYPYQQNPQAPYGQQPQAQPYSQQQGAPQQYGQQPYPQQYGQQQYPQQQPPQVPPQQYPPQPGGYQQPQQQPYPHYPQHPQQ